MRRLRMCIGMPKKTPDTAPRPVRARTTETKAHASSLPVPRHVLALTPIDLTSPLLTPAETAERLHISVRTLANHRYLSPSPGPRWVKVGGRIFYPESEVAAYLAECARVSARGWAS